MAAMPMSTTPPPATGCTMEPTIVATKIARRRQPCGVTPAGGGMSATLRPAASTIAQRAASFTMPQHTRRLPAGDWPTAVSFPRLYSMIGLVLLVAQMFAAEPRSPAVSGDDSTAARRAARDAQH